ncbi:MAG: recombinase [Candidatus Hydrothermarchaeota archaeon]|nr:MAG: recombinase [Candidatus Hydrothermarchaeota archaeon]
MEKLMLHACCAPCATHVVKVLREKYEVIVYFYNPNIHPEEEYHLRMKNMIKLAELYDFPLIIGDYDVELWFERIKGFEKEKEGGERCKLCFELRLEKTAKLAKELGMPIFATTLTISPHKNAEVINSIGKKIAKKYNIKFFEADFKKKNGFKKSVEESKRLNLYRQNYCGCIFSKR